MGIEFGNLELEDLKFGSTQVKKVYSGNTLVWEKLEGLRAFGSSSNTEGISLSVCDLDVDNTYYHTGRNTYPEVGDYVFELINATLPVITIPAPGGIYPIERRLTNVINSIGNGFVTYQTDNTGKVLSTGNCYYPE